MAVAGQTALLQGVSVVAVLAALAVRSGRVELTVRAVTSVSSLLIQRLVEVTMPRHPITLTTCKINLPLQTKLQRVPLEVFGNWLILTLHDNT